MVLFSETLEPPPVTQLYNNRFIPTQHEFPIYFTTTLLFSYSINLNSKAGYKRAFILSFISKLLSETLISLLLLYQIKNSYYFIIHTAAYNYLHNYLLSRLMWSANEDPSLKFIISLSLLKKEKFLNINIITQLQVSVDKLIFEQHTYLQTCVSFILNWSQSVKCAQITKY